MNTHAFTLRAVLKPIASTLSLMLVTAAAAHADTSTTSWNGTANATWSTAGNWASGVPSNANSALFNSTFSTQPQLTSNPTTQGIWLATGAGQDVTISTDGTQRTLTISGNATLNNQSNAGIILSDSADHSLTIGGSSLDPVVVTITNSTGFYVNNAGALTLTGNKSLNLGTNTLTLGGTNASGRISIAQGTAATAGALVVNTAGTVTLNAQNGHTGGTTLSAGTLNINNAKALGGANSTFTLNGGTIDNTSAAAITVGNANPVSVAGNFTFTGTKDLSLGSGSVNLGGSNRTITTTAGRLTLGGVVSNGGIKKSGSGTLALSANNTYAGATTVSAGTLLLTTGGAINSSSNITVESGATIQNANGSSVTAALVLAEGSALLTSSAVSSFGPTSLTLSGNLSDGWTAVSLTATLGSGLIKGGSLTLSLSGLTAGTYNLTSGSGFSGSFSSANVNGNALTLSGSNFTGTNIGGFDFSYTNSTNVLVVTAVPEPTTSALLLATSLTTVMALRRRKNR